MIKNNKLYISGGKWKNQKIYLSNHTLLKPTMNSIRETIFFWLLPKLTNAICLDCYAGSGILAFEAFSRNAKFVTLIENNKTIIKYLYKNINKLNISSNHIQILNKNTLSWLNKYNHDSFKYNIIFIDPPYYQNMINPTILLLNNNNWLEKNAFIYIESENTKLNLKIPKFWQLYKYKINSNNIIQIYFFNKT